MSQAAPVAITAAREAGLALFAVLLLIYADAICGVEVATSPAGLGRETGGTPCRRSCSFSLAMP